MAFWNRKKPIDVAGSADETKRLKPTLSWWHLVAMGVGAIVGTGIYTLTGIGAGLAGPAVILSFALCGVICACAAFCYAEMATMMPAAGSAYTYTYVVLGELLAWIVGWSLILEYTVAASAVAVGWSAHVAEFIQAAGWPVPDQLLHGFMSGGLVDLPAVIISAAVTVLLIIGTRESATINLFLVAIKILALILFVALAAQSFDPARFHPFAPFGLTAHVDPDGVKRGVLAAAALIFFAFYGFDTVSTAAEETKNPSRDLSRGIMGSMVLCTAIYVAVAAAALGASSYLDFSKTGAPLVYILNSLHHMFEAQVVAGAAIVALPTVILVLMYGQSRIFFVMARDGLLPQELSTVHRTRGTPVLMTAITGLVVAGIAATLKLDQIALLANAGTLCAFIAVAVCMLVLRVRDPNRPRVFRTPLPWVIGPVCIIGCLYLFLNGLPQFTQWWFVVWNSIGLVLYLLYGAWRSNLARAAKDAAP
ncbi:MAG TPA: amino acid permease [Rhizomicrobium sp.]|jgi:APA family basic amino acid/polyamine antiporter|nr:amino acid permease [Rhizomicrobium sp.]